MSATLLHISDLHRDRAEGVSNEVLLGSLERDRQRYTGEECGQRENPNIVIVSGDLGSVGKLY